MFCVHAAQTGKHLLRTQNVSDKNQKHFLCLGHKFCVRNKCCAYAGTAEGEGLVGLKPYHFFASVDFLGLQMTWIFYECYHLKETKPVYSCICTKSKDTTRAAKCFGSHVEDMVFRRHPLCGDKGLRTRGETRLGSPNYLLAACCKSCYQRCWRAFFFICPAS